MIIRLILSFLFISNSYASFKELAQEFLETNTDLHKQRFGLAQTRLDIDALDATKVWTLGGEFSYLKDSLDSSSKTNAQSDTQAYELSLSKSFAWGGEASLTNNLNKIEYGQSSFITGNNLNEFSQTLSYSQDFGTDLLGRTFRQQKKVAQLGVKVAQINLDQSSQTMLLKFYSDFIQARLNKTAISLQEEALDRALKREKTIAKRVRDGLREKVDLYQAQISVHGQRESVAQAKQQFQESLNKLANGLNRIVLENEVQIYDLAKFELPDAILGNLEENKVILAQQEQIQLSKESIKETKYSIFPDISLTASYKTNRYHQEQSESISDGLLGGKYSEKAIAVSVSVPLRFESEKTELAQKKIDLLSNEMVLRNELKNLKSSDETLKKRISLVLSNIESSKKKHELAKKALMAQNRLYNLGRADIDQVINSEEQLISTENGFAQFLSNYEILLGQQSLLYGKLEEFLKLTD